MSQNNHIIFTTLVDSCLTAKKINIKTLQFHILKVKSFKKNIGNYLLNTYLVSKITNFSDLIKI